MWAHKGEELEADGEQSDGDAATLTAGSDNAEDDDSGYRNFLVKMVSPLKLDPGTTDPVSLILQKIDAELEATEEPRRVLRTDLIHDSRNGSHQERRKMNFSGPRSPGDLDRKNISSAQDSLSARELDVKFKDILRQKGHSRLNPASTASPRFQSAMRPPSRLQATGHVPSATGAGWDMMATGYGTDNDSIRTEDFESQFNSLLVQGSDSEFKGGPAGGVGQRSVTGQATPVASLKPTRSARFAQTPTFEAFDRPKTALKSTRSAATETIGNDTTQTRQSETTFSVETTKNKTTRPRSLSPAIVRKTEASNDPVDGSSTRSLPMERDTLAWRRSRSSSPPLGSRGLPLSLPANQERSQPVKPPTYQQDVTNLKTMDPELKVYSQALLVSRKDLVEVRAELKHVGDMAERAKSELMALEFKRGTASQELERLNGDMTRKRQQLSALDSELATKAEDVKIMSSMGVTREECLQVVSLRQEVVNCQSRLRGVEGLELERDELVRQLETTKEELFREQRMARTRLEELQEDMDNLTAALEDMEVQVREHQQQVKMLETSVQDSEKEKEALIQDHTQQLERLKATSQEEHLQLDTRLTSRLADLEVELQDFRVKVNDLKMENLLKDALSEKLRCEMNEMGTIIDKERREHQKASLQHRKVLTYLKKETASAVSKLKESMFLERQKALEKMKKDLQEEKRDRTVRTEERLVEMQESHSQQMAEKTAQIESLQDTIHKMEAQLTVDMGQEIEEAVGRELQRMEQELNWKLQKDKEENSNRSGELEASLEREKQTNKDLLEQIRNLKKDQEDQRRQQRESSQEKLVAVARAREQTREQGSAELEKVKFSLRQEHEAEVDRLKDKLRIQEQDIAKLKQESETQSERERNTSKVLEHLVKAVTSELYKMSQVIAGMTGRALNGPLQRLSFHTDHNDDRSTHPFKNRSLVNTALGTLQGCLEELRLFTSGLKQEVDSLKRQLDAVNKEKEEAVSKCRQEMDRQRISDLDMLKEKLLKEHVTEMSQVIHECAEVNLQVKAQAPPPCQHNPSLLEALRSKERELDDLHQAMLGWQRELEQRAQTRLQLQLAQEKHKYQALQHNSMREQKRINDLQKKEIDRLELELLRMASLQGSPSRHMDETPSDNRPQPATPPATPLPHRMKSTQLLLQDRIDQLELQNLAIRKHRLVKSGQMSWSTSNLTKLISDRSPSPVGTLLAVPVGSEFSKSIGQTKVAEDRTLAQEDEKFKLKLKMNNRQEEMNKLEQRLYLQNKELQELERSYNDLQKYSRSSSPNRDLNTGRT